GNRGGRAPRNSQFLTYQNDSDNKMQIRFCALRHSGARPPAHPAGTVRFHSVDLMLRRPHAEREVYENTKNPAAPFIPTFSSIHTSGAAIRPSTCNPLLPRHCKIAAITPPRMPHHTVTSSIQTGVHNHHFGEPSPELSRASSSRGGVSRAGRIHARVAHNASPAANPATSPQTWSPTRSLRCRISRKPTSGPSQQLPSTKKRTKPSSAAGQVAQLSSEPASPRLARVAPMISRANRSAGTGSRSRRSRPSSTPTNTGRNNCEVGDWYGRSTSTCTFSVSVCPALATTRTVPS